MKRQKLPATVPHRVPAAPPEAPADAPAPPSVGRSPIFGCLRRLAAGGGASWPLLVAGIGWLLVGPSRLPGEVRGSVELGVEQFEAGELAAARATLEGALAGEGERHRALAYLGRISLAENELDPAIERLKEAVELAPADSMYRTWLGRAYILKLQSVSFFERGVLAGRALDALRKAVELDPANAEARVSLAGYYLNAPALAGGSKRKAREQVQILLDLDPARGSLILAGIQAKDGEHDLAIETLGRCLELQPESSECRYQLAMLHQEREQFESAFEAFERLLEVEPDSRGALYQLGRTAVFSGARIERGIECLEKYLALDVRPGHPGHDAAHWRLGMLFERRGNASAARTEYERAIGLNPEESRYRDSLEALGLD